jgi:hypothetical protein
MQFLERATGFRIGKRANFYRAPLSIRSAICVVSPWKQAVSLADIAAIGVAWWVRYANDYKSLSKIKDCGKK